VSATPFDQSHPRGSRGTSVPTISRFGGPEAGENLRAERRRRQPERPDLLDDAGVAKGV
jgi:hypothetical protein